MFAPGTNSAASTPPADLIFTDSTPSLVATVLSRRCGHCRRD
jgi:hypothetical protein